MFRVLSIKKQARRIAGMALALAYAAPADAAPDVTHSVIYHNASEFAGWPANCGLWAWGAELLVGFQRWTYQPIPDEYHHAQAPFLGTTYYRSLDGGATWAPATVSFYNSPSFPPLFPYDFGGSSFGMRLWQNAIYFTTNRGLTWRGADISSSPFPELGGSSNYARTNYVVTGADSALAFISTDEDGTKPQRSYVARVHAGGVFRQFLSWIDDPAVFAGPLQDDVLVNVHGPVGANPYVHSIMPAAVSPYPNQFVAALRRRVDDDRWSDIYRSTDGGNSWTLISELERGADNPVALVHLGGDKLAAIYGQRTAPYGLHAKVSLNGGHTWSRAIVLRADGLNKDLGYPRATLGEDGKVRIAYYYTTAALPEQHIAFTVWDPTDDLATAAQPGGFTWYASHTGGVAEIEPGEMRLHTTNTLGESAARAVGAQFQAITLRAGETLRLAFDFSCPGQLGNSIDAFRVGLFDSLRLDENWFSKDGGSVVVSSNSSRGYTANLNPKYSAATGVGAPELLIQERTGRHRFMTSGTAYEPIGAWQSFAAVGDVVPNTTYHAEFLVKRVDYTGGLIKAWITVEISGGDLPAPLFLKKADDDGDIVTRFDTIGFSIFKASSGGMTDVTISNLVLELEN